MTDLKRVIVYFTEEEKQEIEAISKAMGQSMSSVIGDVFREAVPHLRVVAEAVKLAKTNPAEALKMIRSAGYESQLTLLDELKKLDK
tara:strand:- start:29 stop:289 length:261 start_codon:yes stop_codon:yes gene_type:complete